MCVIFVANDKREILELGEKRIKRAWDANSDGAGIMYHDGKRIRIARGLMTFQHLMHVLKNKVKKDCPLAIHFRLATHGKAIPKNTHPFIVDEFSALMHNGVLSALGTAGDDGTSDTGHLARLLRFLPDSERENLLQNVNGKFVYGGKDGITYMGGFTALDKTEIMVSNEYWDRGWTYATGYGYHRRKYAHYDSEACVSHWKPKTDTTQKTLELVTKKEDNKPAVYPVSEMLDAAEKELKARIEEENKELNQLESDIKKDVAPILDQFGHVVDDPYSFPDSGNIMMGYDPTATGKEPIN